MCQHLTEYLDSNDLLSPHQFGFRAGRSTLEQLLLVYNTVSECTDKGGTVDIILFDFSKAFDVVVHELIVSKLHCLGIRGPYPPVDQVLSFGYKNQGLSRRWHKYRGIRERVAIIRKDNEGMYPGTHES